MKKITSYILILFTINLWAQVPDKENPTEFYNNFSKEFPNFISDNEAQQINFALKKYSNETKYKIYIVIEDDISKFIVVKGRGIASQYGIDEQNNLTKGLLILIDPKALKKGVKTKKYLYLYGNAFSNRHFFIGDEVFISNYEIAPYLEGGEHYKALLLGIDAVKKSIEGKYIQERGIAYYLIATLLVVVGIIIILMLILGVYFLIIHFLIISILFLKIILMILRSCFPKTKQNKRIIAFEKKLSRNLKYLSKKLKEGIPIRRNGKWFKFICFTRKRTDELY